MLFTMPTSGYTQQHVVTRCMGRTKANGTARHTGDLWDNKDADYHL